MDKVYTIAEGAQGYEGSLDIALLLVKGACASGADAIKFQVIFADDLAEPGYEYYDLFRQLEMELVEWRKVREFAHEKQIHFIADVFGKRSIDIAVQLDVDGIKLHSTSFFDEELIREVLSMDKDIYISVGGIEEAELIEFLELYKIKANRNLTIMYGYQAEPTPIGSNNLQRISSLKALTGLEIGFMDHSDGEGTDNIYLSVLALGMGVRKFEKHITLDRELQLEDYISAVTPSTFRQYVSTLQRLVDAVGSSSLQLSAEERVYRGKALKRIVANRDLKAGITLRKSDIRLSRPKNNRGCFKPVDVIGKHLKNSVREGEPIEAEEVS